MAPEHSPELIQKLFDAFDSPLGAGGMTNLAAALDNTPTQTVHAWKTNGVPRWRKAAIVQKAFEMDIALPPEVAAYLDPKGEALKGAVKPIRGPHSSASAPETSAAAAECIAAHTPKLRQQVEDFAKRCGRSGFIDESLYLALAPRSENSVRPRRSELADANILIDSGRRQKNGRGRECVVWVHRDFADNPPPIVTETAPKKRTAEQERTAVVAWLRSLNAHYQPRAEKVADQIERGKHLS